MKFEDIKDHVGDCVAALLASGDLHYFHRFNTVVARTARDLSQEHPAMASKMRELEVLTLATAFAVMLAERPYSQEVFDAARCIQDASVKGGESRDAELAAKIEAGTAFVVGKGGDA